MVLTPIPPLILEEYSPQAPYILPFSSRAALDMSHSFRWFHVLEALR